MSARRLRASFHAGEPPGTWRAAAAPKGRFPIAAAADAPILQRLSRELARGARRDQPTSIVLAALDHLTSIADTYGERAADEALQHVTHMIGACIRPDDALGRYGGQELLVVLRRCDGAMAGAFAERIRGWITAVPLGVGRSHVSLSVSLGVAAQPGGRVGSTMALLAAADAALYRAKAEGGNRAAVAGEREMCAGRSCS